MVRPRGKKFQVDFRHGNERIRRSFDTEVEALKWEAWAKERLAKGLSLEEAVVKDGLTMASLAEMVRAKYWAGRPNEDNAVRNAEEMVELLGPDRHPKEITESDIDTAVAKLKAKGNSAATINRKIAALTKMFTHAVTRGMIDRKPHIEKMKEREGRIRWYTLDEERAILDKINQFRIEGFADLVVFLLDTGCRLSEALALEARYTSDTHVVFERTKNGRRRSVPLTARSREIIERRRRGLAPTDRIFSEWDKSRAHRAWDRVRRAVGLAKDPEAVLHACRHTCASRLVQAGVPIQVVQQWLGHRTLTMTLKYAHLAPVNLLQAVRALDKTVTTPTRPHSDTEPLVTTVTTSTDKVRLHSGTELLVTTVTTAPNCHQTYAPALVTGDHPHRTFSEIVDSPHSYEDPGDLPLPQGRPGEGMETGVRLGMRVEPVKTGIF